MNGGDKQPWQVSTSSDPRQRELRWSFFGPRFDGFNSYWWTARLKNQHNGVKLARPVIYLSSTAVSWSCLSTYVWKWIIFSRETMLNLNLTLVVFNWGENFNTTVKTYRGVSPSAVLSGSCLYIRGLPRRFGYIFLSNGHILWPKSVLVKKLNP